MYRPKRRGVTLAWGGKRLVLKSPDNLGRPQRWTNMWRSRVATCSPRSGIEDLVASPVPVLKGAYEATTTWRPWMGLRARRHDCIAAHLRDQRGRRLRERLFDEPPP